jgi:hypothetical protein
VKLLEGHHRSIVGAYNGLREATAEMPPNYPALAEARTAVDKFVSSAKCESKRISNVFNLKPKPKGKAKASPQGEAAEVTEAEA